MKVSVRTLLRVLGWIAYLPTIAMVIFSSILYLPCFLPYRHPSFGLGYFVSFPFAVYGILLLPVYLFHRAKIGSRYINLAMFTMLIGAMVGVLIIGVFFCTPWGYRFMRGC